MDFLTNETIERLIRKTIKKADSEYITEDIRCIIGMFLEELKKENVGQINNMYYFDSIELNNYKEIKEKQCLDVYRGEITGMFNSRKNERDILVDFCKVFFIKGNKNEAISSYGLKHIAENIIGFYVSNSDMKAAMCAAGFKPHNISDINWVFGISNKSPALNLDSFATNDLLKKIKNR